MIEEYKNLLQSAAIEIKSLRSQNQLMRARLDMFDNVMTVLHTKPAYPTEVMSEDLVHKIEECLKK